MRTCRPTPAKAPARSSGRRFWNRDRHVCWSRHRQPRAPAARILAKDRISVPPPAAVYLDNTSAMANEVTAKYGLTTGRLFLLGIRVVDATFGAAIGGDVKTRLTGLASLLKSSVIPTSVWSTQLQAVQAKAIEPELKKLDEAIDEHLKRLPGVLPGKL